MFQFKSNNMGIRYRITLLLELTSLGAIFTSYDVETRVLDTKSVDNMLVRDRKAESAPHPPLSDPPSSQIHLALVPRL